MFCENCGNALENGAKFCPNCGAPVAVPQVDMEKTVTVWPGQDEPAAEEPVAAQQPVYETPAEPVYQQPQAPVYQQPQAPTYQQPVNQTPVDPALNGMSKSILIFGIIGLAFSCSFYLSLLGIIFSAIAKGKVKSFLAAGGQLTGKAKVGSILAKVGLILGIVLTVLFVFWLFAIVIAAVKGQDISYMLN